MRTVNLPRKGLSNRNQTKSSASPIRRLYTGGANKTNLSLNNWTIRIAVKEWIQDRESALVKYGHISLCSPNEDFGKAETTFQSAFSKHFSTFRSPNRVLTPLKSASKNAF